MGIGKLLHDHADDGGTIDRPRLYEALGAVAFAGRRRSLYLRLAALSGARPGDRVLDVGCGTGYLTRLLAPLVVPGGQVVGVDASARMIEYARGHAPAACSYQVGEGQSLDLADSSVDVVVTSLAMHHIPAGARAEAAREMHRVLRPGGRLLVAEFRPPSTPLLAHVVGALSGPAMRDDLREQLNGLFWEAGFTLQGGGRLGSVLYYLRAIRPAIVPGETL